MKYIDVVKLKNKVNVLRQDLLGNSTGLEVAEEGAELGAAESILDSIDDIISSLQQEQTEVDLGKEVRRWKNKHGVVGMDDLWLKFANHIYELGLNARKK